MSVLSKDWFEIDGVRSHTVGVYVDTPPMPPMAKARYDTYTPAGYDQDVTYHTGDYDDIRIEINCYTFEKDFDPTAFYTFLRSGNNLVTSRYSKYRYKIKQLLDVIPRYSDNGKAYYTVTFVCSPFRYSVDDKLEVYTNQTFTVNGNVYCEPLIVVSIEEERNKNTDRNVALQLIREIPEMSEENAKKTLDEILQKLQEPSQSAQTALAPYGGANALVYDEFDQMRSINDIFSKLNEICSSVSVNMERFLESVFWNEIEAEATKILQECGVNWQEYQDLPWAQSGGIQTIAANMLFIYVKKRSNLISEVQYFVTEYDMKQEDVLTATEAIIQTALRYRNLRDAVMVLLANTGNDLSAVTAALLSSEIKWYVDYYDHFHWSLFMDKPDPVKNIAKQFMDAYNELGGNVEMLKSFITNSYGIGVADSITIADIIREKSKEKNTNFLNLMGEFVLYIQFDGIQYLEIPGLHGGDAVTIDCEHKLVYDNYGEIRRSSGDFPILEPGEHRGSIGSEDFVVKVYMRKNERWV